MLLFFQHNELVLVQIANPRVVWCFRVHYSFCALETNSAGSSKNGLRLCILHNLRVLFTNFSFMSLFMLNI